MNILTIFTNLFGETPKRDEIHVTSGRAETGDFVVIRDYSTKKSLATGQVVGKGAPHPDSARIKVDWWKS